MQLGERGKKDTKRGYVGGVQEQLVKSPSGLPRTDPGYESKQQKLAERGKGGGAANFVLQMPK